MTAPRNALVLVGAIFLALGVFKLLSGGAWVVWIILGVLFGGLSVFTGRKGTS